ANREETIPRSFYLAERVLSRSSQNGGAKPSPFSYPPARPLKLASRSARRSPRQPSRSPPSTRNAAPTALGPDGRIGPARAAWVRRGVRSVELGNERVDLLRPLPPPTALGGIVEPGPVDTVQHELPKVLRPESHRLGHCHVVAGRIRLEHRWVVAVDHDLQPSPRHLPDRVVGQVLPEVHPRR